MHIYRSDMKAGHYIVMHTYKWCGGCHEPAIDKVKGKRCVCVCVYIYIYTYICIQLRMYIVMHIYQ